MKLAVDLHIHSGLSPCAEFTMTPNNIINMAKLKGLDAIAITDHNSLKNIEVFLKVANKNDIICIPGVEITTKEEVHVLGYFETIESVREFQRIIDMHLPRDKNNKEMFGNQLIYDENDNIIGEEQMLLSRSIGLSLEEIIDEIRKLNGIPIPAHINRNRFSIISNLGFINPELKINAIEICGYGDLKSVEKLCPNFESYNKIYSSDAHSLGQILEREFFVEVERQSIKCIINALEKSNK
ncbi:PHP domain-containing protein [Serpentinicella alkaliphila]|uniref:Polymerase/histidinol phosphatase N-terminal domain-containing protein n=1 Tax=Serpentinicella alkaliphila TaxID=1734049 RepID=A0A4R2T931_9FIRM|nr:PHP domain-containing protein [Serpentinicella alkaliphila]QUH26045.1 PHP domain-containing protein [Serpentinicella alkaliphila]TCP99739.1 hypothetical protein EDD79_103427 [Serpentinicella alkaliphila]